MGGSPVLPGRSPVSTSSSARPGQASCLPTQVQQMQKVIQLDPRDNVLIALTDLKQGEQVEFNGTTYSLISNVPAKHKFATADLPLGADVIMYGVLVGKASQPVKNGEALTLANLRHEAADYHKKAREYHWAPPEVSSWRQRKFLGYRRSDGQVGTR